MGNSMGYGGYGSRDQDDRETKDSAKFYDIFGQVLKSTDFILLKNLQSQGMW